MLHIFIFPVEFSKYDFWIPGKISHRHSKKIHQKIFFVEIKTFCRKSRKNILRDQKMFEKNLRISE